MTHRNRVTRADLARRLGVTPGAVRKALISGRIQREPDGTFDLEKALAAWKSNSDPARIKAQISRVPRATVPGRTGIGRAAGLLISVLAAEGAGIGEIDRRCR